MPTVMTEGVKMCCKAVKANLFKVAGLLVVNSTVIEKPMGYIEAYIYISQTHLAVASRSPVIPPSLPTYILLLN